MHIRYGKTDDRNYKCYKIDMVDQKPSEISTELLYEHEEIRDFTIVNNESTPNKEFEKVNKMSVYTWEEIIGLKVGKIPQN